jgi:Mg/Co/Ni transporter MgtE
MTMRLVFTTAFILTVVPVTLHGQPERINALALEAGTRARILGAPADSKFTLITVASTEPDSLLYSLGGNSNTRSLGWQQITKMEVSAGRHRHLGLGLGLGFLTGILAGIALGATGQHGETRTLNELSGAIGGATFGTIIGGTAGFFWRTERWIPVYLPQP